MGRHRHAVLQRREVLLAKIAEQRVELSDLASRWQPVLSIADKSLSLLGFMRAHVLWLAGVASFVVIRGSGLVGLLRITRRAWKTYRYLNSFIKKATSRL